MEDYIIEKWNNPNIEKVYVTMYGYEPQDDTYIELKKKEEIFLDKENSRLIYWWGFNSYSTYYFKNYGISWAFHKEDLLYNDKEGKYGNSVL